MPLGRPPEYHSLLIFLNRNLFIGKIHIYCPFVCPFVNNTFDNQIDKMFFIGRIQT